MSETPVAAYRRVGSEVSRYQDTPQEPSGAVHKVEKGNGDSHRVDTYRSESASQPAVTETYRRAPNGSLVKTYEKQHPNGVHEASCLTLDKTSSNKFTVYTRSEGRITTVTETVRPDGSRTTTKQDGNGKSVTVNYDTNGKRIPDGATTAPPQATSPGTPSSGEAPPVPGTASPTPTSSPSTPSSGEVPPVPGTTVPDATPSPGTPPSAGTPSVPGSPSPVPTPDSPAPASPSGTPPNVESDRKAFYDHFQEHKTQGNEAAYRDSLKTLASQGNRYAAQRLRDLQGKDLAFNASEARDHEQLATLHGRMADDTTTWALASAALLTGTWATGAAVSGTAVAATGGATASAGGATAVGGTAALGSTGGSAVASGLATTATGGATSALATTGGASTAALATTGTAASASDLMVARTLQQLVNLRVAGDTAASPFLMPALRLTGAAGIRSLIL